MGAWNITMEYITLIFFKLCILISYKLRRLILGCSLRCRPRSLHPLSRGFSAYLCDSLWSECVVRRGHGALSEEEQDIDEMCMENVIHFAEFALSIGALIWGHICLLAYKWTSAWSYAWTPWSRQLPNRLKAWRCGACQWESEGEGGSPAQGLRHALLYLSFTPAQ